MVPVLLISNDKEFHTILKTVLPAEYIILSAFSGAEGLRLMQTEEPEVILLTSHLPDTAAIDLLYRITNSPFAPPVIIISNEDDVSFIVQSMKRGAHDYIKKPFEIKHLKSCLLKAVQTFARNQTLLHQNLDIPELSALIGTSGKIVHTKQSIRKYAPSDLPVLITGESGTGKELIAQAIHNLSNYRDGPFIPKNCGAIPASLIQSELFGSEPGAYTDAISKPGSFELAHNGSLFLDEIGEMDLSAQVHLLRILENNELVRMGGIKKIPVNVRVITATNKDLPLAVKHKEFRQDLYYRINVLVLNTSPLRERKSDISTLAQHFISLTGKHNYYFTTRALQKMIDYAWPGNVRELKAVVERALLLTDKNIIGPSSIRF